MDNEQQKLILENTESNQEVCSPVLPGKKQLLLVFLLLAAVIGTIYSNTLHAGYHLDDRGTLCLDEDNLRYAWCDPLPDPSNLSAIWNKGPGRFLSNLTFSLNYYFGGMNVLGYHLVNISIHILASFMVYFYLLRRSQQAFKASTNLRMILARISGDVLLVKEVLNDKDKVDIAALKPASKNVLAKNRILSNLSNISFVAPGTSTNL